MPWIDDDIAGDSDTWAGFAEERAELATFIASLDTLKGRFFMLSGDMHASAFGNEPVPC